MVKEQLEKDSETKDKGRLKKKQKEYQERIMALKSNAELKMTRVVQTNMAQLGNQPGEI